MLGVGRVGCVLAFRLGERRNDCAVAPMVINDGASSLRANNVKAVTRESSMTATLAEVRRAYLTSVRFVHRSTSNKVVTGREHGPMYLRDRDGLAGEA